MAQTVKNLHAIQETQIGSLDQEDPLEKGMAIHSSILAWEFHGQRRLLCTLDCKELDTTEQLTPLPWWLLQYSCIKYINKIMPKSKYNGDLSVSRGKETWNRKEVQRGKTPCNLLKCQCMKLKENYMIVKLEREIHIVDLK